MMTRLAPPFRCAAAFSRTVNRPVDSITTSTPLSPHGISAGSRSSSFLTSRPSIEKPLSLCLTSFASVRPTESCLSRNAIVCGVAEGVVDRHELDVRLLAAGEDRPGERSADATESVDADTYCHASVSSLTRGATTAEPKAPSPVVARSCPIPSGSGDRRRHRLGAEGDDRRPIDGEPVIGVVQELVDPAAVLVHRREVVGSVVARRLVFHGQVRDLDDPARAPCDRGPDLGYAEHGDDARVERSRREHDLVGAGDRLERVGAGGRVGGLEPHLADAGELPRPCDRDLAGHFARHRRGRSSTPARAWPGAPGRPRRAGGRPRRARR